MKEKNLKILKTIFLGGLLYAILQAAFDLYDLKEFNWVKFLINTIFFAFFMGLMLRKNFVKN
ncbi:hypothetical protein [Flavobacterium sp. GP15]|uniref:hypothetical protein n=1 Tax=Flavobacterium sp. GP15 TaxID=2758567 RepID=UPI00165D5D4D|nr:hypothetical protein [Flavobacterium sp. GP15]